MATIQVRDHGGCLKVGGRRCLHKKDLNPKAMAKPQAKEFASSEKSNLDIRYTESAANAEQGAMPTLV